MAVARRSLGAPTLARVAAAGLGLPVVLAFLLMALWPPVSAVETGQTPEYPELQPVAYPLGRERVFAAAQELAAAWPGAQLVATDPGSGTVVFVAPARWSRLTARVQIRVDENGTGGSIAFVRSDTSGRGDFGQNARNIERAMRVLDSQLSLRRSGSE